MLRMKNMIGLLLCTLVLSASVPLLLGIDATPGNVFRGDMVALTQVNSTVRLDMDLVEELKSQPDVAAASGEITCFTVLKGFPTVVRGVVLDDFLAVENSTIVEGQVGDRSRFAVLGRGLARQVGLSVGDSFVLTGSSEAAIYQMRVDAICQGRYSENELLVPLDYARKMSGMGSDSVLIIRVRTTNQTAFVESLEEQDTPVVVTDPQGTVTPVNVELSQEEIEQQQLAIRYLNTEQFKASNGSYVSLFVQEGGDSVRVVVGTFIVLDGALAFIGSAAIISRAVIERRSDLGIISAIGADRRYIRRMILRDVLVLSTLASLAGILLGYGIVQVVEDRGLLLMFGEAVHAVIDPYILTGIFLMSVLIHVLSGLMVTNVLTRVSPRSMLEQAERPDTEVKSPPLEDVLGVDA